MNLKDDYYREVRDFANDYAETVSTLIAFAAFVCHDGQIYRENSGFGFGRHMKTSPANPVSPSTIITPDCVAQKNESYGIVAEVKKRLSQDSEQWRDHCDQLRKYDDDLTGWWTLDERIQTSDVVMLIHQSRGRVFTRFLKEEAVRDPTLVGANTSVVEFNRSDETQQYIFFRQAGKKSVRDSQLAHRLDEGIPIPSEKVLQSFPNIKFYDSRPPMEDLMKTLWMDSFLSRFDATAIDPSTGIALISVTVTELTDELQRAYGSQALRSDRRSAEFPKSTWVRSALEMFVSLDIATARGGETFAIKYKIFPANTDVLEKFCSLVQKKQVSKKPVDGQQLLLPFGDAGK